MYLGEINKLTYTLRLGGFGDILWITHSYYMAMTLMSACQLSTSGSDLQGNKLAVVPSVDTLTPSEETSRGNLSAGKAPTTASAAKTERAAKREKRIVIKLRIGKLGG
jgi:hypothetical protein